MVEVNMNRELKIVAEAIKKVDLKLNGLIILTEVGSNNYVFTPIIALMSGAQKVFAWTKDSQYGRGMDNISKCIEICNKLGLDHTKIEFSIEDRPVEHIKRADIITNLGFVRPLNQYLLKNINKNAVISYMCESWEIREIDIDIDYCIQRRIPVAGVWENHPDLLVFEYCGNLIAKLCYEAGFEIRGNRILIISSDNFGLLANKHLLCCGAKKVDLVCFADLQSEAIEFNQYDFVLLADYKSKFDLFANFQAQVSTANNNLTIIHLCGLLEFEKFRSIGVRVFPPYDGFANRMSKTLDYLGPEPVILLHAAGLKVGELMKKNKTSRLIQSIV